MRTIADRMRWVIGNWLPERKRFTTLEKLSGIPSGHWKNFWHGKQRAHEHMIQALARQWPEYALWLVTGIDDPEAGQTTPPASLPSHEARTTTGRLLARKVELDESFNSTQALAVLNDEKLGSQRNSGDGEQIVRGYIEKFVEAFVELDEVPVNTDGSLRYGDVLNDDAELQRLVAERNAERR
ncbi:MAG: hypothetical protein WA049_11625 [Ferribacterium limneticum]